MEGDGLHEYPKLATVTYLSTVGGPTVVLPCPGTVTEVKKKSTSTSSSSSSSAQAQAERLVEEHPLKITRFQELVFSKPRMGKHLYVNM